VICNPDIKIEKITPDVNFVVITCDGIWEVFESQQVVDFIYQKMKEEMKLSKIVEALFDAIMSPGPSK